MNKKAIYNYYITCACGCGEKLLKYHPIWGRGNPERKCINGHQWRNRKQTKLHITNRVKSFKSNEHKIFHHSQETKNRISAAMKGKPKSKQMVDRFTKYVKTRGKVAFKYGHFYSNKNQRKMFYRSSYELQAYRILEQMNMVEKYIYEPFSINYKLNGDTYIYHPDLLVIYKDGTKQLLEIKPKKELDDIVNIKKFEGAKDFCLDNKINFKVWTEDELFIKSLSASMKKVANSVEPNEKSTVIPNQAENINSQACVESINDPRKG